MMKAWKIIIDSMDSDPDGWTSYLIGRFPHCKHTKTGVIIWLSGGFWVCDNESAVQFSIPFWRSWQVDRAVKRLQQYKLAQAMSVMHEKQLMALPTKSIDDDGYEQERLDRVELLNSLIDSEISKAFRR